MPWHQGMGLTASHKEQNYRSGEEPVHSHGRAELTAGREGEGKATGSVPGESMVTGDAQECAAMGERCYRCSKGMHSHRRGTVGATVVGESKVVHGHGRAWLRGVNGMRGHHRAWL